MALIESNLQMHPDGSGEVRVKLAAEIFRPERWWEDCREAVIQNVAAEIVKQKLPDILAKVDPVAIANLAIAQSAAGIKSVLEAGAPIKK